MASEPINIFSFKIDPRGVLRVLRSHASDVIVTGPEDDWTQADVIFVKKGLLRRERKLSIGHRADYYDGPDWPKQKFGMMNYFSSFPENPNKSAILRLIRSFRFSLSVPCDDLDIDGNDDRLKLLVEVCRHLDGVFFTPTSLRDSSGRILISRYVAADPEAVLPAIPPESNDEEENREDDEDEEYKPPSRERIIKRTLALTAVAARATLELDALNGDLDDGEVHRTRMLDWVATCDIDDELEPEEWKVLQRPVTKLEQQDFINAMWRVEGLAVLAWSLGLHPLPAYDELVIPGELYESIGIFDADAAIELNEKVELRSKEELQTMHDHLLAFHWRIRDFSLRPNLMDFAEFSKTCWFGSFDVSRFRLIQGDLAIGDRPLTQTEPDELGRISSLAVERHTAINWLRGESALYSQVETHT